MKCPYCGTQYQLRVVDTTHDTDDSIRRRRECLGCGKRFTTTEKIMQATPLLIKGNGDREAFDRDKLIRGIQISCAKRPIPAAGINCLVDQIETHLQHMGQDEVPSQVVGDMVIDGLKELDPIAYIRYAIVYLGLDNLASVRDMLDSLLADQSARPNARRRSSRVRKRAKSITEEAAPPAEPSPGPAQEPDLQPPFDGDMSS